MAQIPVELEWQVRNTDPSVPLEEVLLTQRGHHSPDQRERFCNPDLSRDCHDPFLLPDMEAAVERLRWALNWRELIVVFGDYDADGVTATVLLYEALERLGARVAYQVPHRLNAGYGLNPKGVEQAAEWGAGLIVTVDNGTTAYEGAARAAELGVDLVITDHHQPGPSRPEALAVVNPNLPGSAYPFGGISGVGVALKLSQALSSGDSPRGAAPVPRASELELAALGTVADVSPMVDENRALVKEGLTHLGQTRRPGLVCLLEAAQAKGVVDTATVGFKLGPRLNAAGRMEAADVAVEVLLSREPERCQRLAKRLEEVNLQRRAITEDNAALARTLVEEAPDQPLLAVHHPSFHPGVAGLVAGRLMDYYHRPVLVLTSLNGQQVGSARSPPGFNIAAALDQCDDLLVSHGGHPAAAGVTLDPLHREALEERLIELARKWAGSQGPTPQLQVDSLVEPERLVTSLLDRLAVLAPFGRENPQPVLALESALVDKSISIGRARNHLRLEVSAKNRRFKAVGWNLGEWAGALDRGQRIALAFTLEKERWRGREGLQLNLKGLLNEPLN